MREIDLIEYFFLRKLGQLLNLNAFSLAEYIIYIFTHTYIYTPLLGMSYEANFKACKDHAKQANNVIVWKQAF